MLAISMTLSGCNGQAKISENQLKKDSPQTNIKVTKEYDEKGNLVKYDSSYSSYYSNVKGDTTLRDSIFQNFTNHFNRSYTFSDHPYFKNFFFQDSLLMYDFYKKDFFFDRYRNNMEHMDSLFREMDLIKNDFFRKQVVPPLK
jgi:hypothetical protein